MGWKENVSSAGKEHKTQNDHNEQQKNKLDDLINDTISKITKFSKEIRSHGVICQGSVFEEDTLYSVKYFSEGSNSKINGYIRVYKLKDCILVEYGSHRIMKQYKSREKINIETVESFIDFVTRPKVSIFKKLFG